MKDIIQIKDLVFSYKHNENTEDRRDSKTVNRNEEMKKSSDKAGGNETDTSRGTEGEGEKISMQNRVIDEVSLNIAEGSFTAIIGRNGSGKSTLAKNINALLLPNFGEVIVEEFNTSDEKNVWEIRQRVGMVFQNPDNQIVSSVVEDDVAFGPENLGIEPRVIRQRVDYALAAVNMSNFKKKPPHMLSGGQKQRIAIAGVVAMKPKCIVFDEPTAMLDPKGRKEVMRIIKELNSEGITVILITHFMEEAAQADRIIIMDRGKIAADGSPVEIFQEVDKLRELSLDVPLEVKLRYRLEKRGIEIPKEVIDRESMVKFLCQYM